MSHRGSSPHHRRSPSSSRAAWTLLCLFVATSLSNSLVIKHDRITTRHAVMRLHSASTGLEHNMTDMQNTFSSSMEQRNLRFSGVARLYTTPSKNNKKNGEESTDDDHLRILDRLQASSVVVVGLGGVGSWAAEALCRSGVGHLTLVDLDDICISNTNRQLHALESSVGKMKIDVMKERLQQINPDCNIHLVHDFVSAGNVGTLLQNIDPPATACLDAIDGSRSKTALIAACARQRIPVVTCGGSAGRTDPSKFVCEDLTRATGDPLLSTCRRELRRDYGFEEGVRFRTSDPTKNRSKLPRKWNIQAVYSTEPQKSLPGGGTDGASSLRRCDGALGTACFVTGTSGFLAAGKVVDMIATNKLKPPKTFPGNVALNPKT